MPSVVVEEQVAAPAEVVYRLACNIEAIQQYAEPVKSIRTVETGDGYAVTEWTVLFQGRPLHWLERDEFDEAHLTIRYHQTEGDLAKFEGDWTFPENDGITTIRLLVDFDLGIPMLAAMLNPIASAITRKSSQALVRAIKTQALEAVES